jgi:sugar phosphate permease
MFNGVFLATGAPACAKICTRWFSISERGTKWSIWNISQQVGAGLVFILSGMVGTWLNWRGIFLWPGLICILGAGFIWLRLGDRPESKGLPPVDIYRNDPETATTNESVHGETSSFFHLVVHRVLMNRNLLIIALASMFVYIVRVGTLDWMTKYLVEEKEQNLILGSGLTSMIEFFGIPSCLLVGWISDRFFRARRAPICVIFLLALTFAIGFVYFVPPGHPYLDGLSLALVGFFIYGPQMMLAGVASADTGGSQVAAAAVGVTGVFSYLGATISSIGTGVILDVSGWGGGFVFWTCCSLVACILLIPLWNVRGRQKQASR